MLLDGLAVRRSITSPSAHGSADDKWSRYFAIVHPLKLGGVIDDLVGRERQEIAKHDFADRPQPCQSETGGHAYDRRLANWRIANATRKKPAQIARNLEGPAVWPFDVFSQQKGALVALQFSRSAL